MTDQQPPELFSERPVRSDFARAPSYRIRRVVTCLVLVGLIGGGIYCIVRWNRAPGEIPTIKADLPLKKKPDQPGGIDIPNQDVLAYQQIDNSGSKPPVEHLLPPPETPQPGNVIPAPSVAPVPQPPPSIETLAAPPPPPIVTTVSPQTPNSVPVQAPENVAPPPSAAPAAVVEQAPAVPAPPVSASVPAPPVVDNPAPPVNSPPAKAETAADNERAVKSPPATGGKNSRIQLASFPDKETASQQMARMERKYAGQLGPARLHLVKADLGARGIYWRVQSNPVTENEARDICAALKKRKTGCILVKP